MAHNSLRNQTSSSKATAVRPATGGCPTSAGALGIPFSGGSVHRGTHLVSFGALLCYALHMNERTVSSLVPRQRHVLSKSQASSFYVSFFLDDVLGTQSKSMIFIDLLLSIPVDVQVKKIAIDIRVDRQPSMLVLRFDINSCGTIFLSPIKLYPTNGSRLFILEDRGRQCSLAVLFYYLAMYSGIVFPHGCTVL